jgi:putative methyltransferase (TIGR04325 family)
LRSRNIFSYDVEKHLNRSQFDGAWLQHLIRQADDFGIGKLGSGRFEYVDRLPPKVTYLPLLLSDKCSPCVVDFGGSNGWVADAVLRSTRSEIDYYVIEVPEVAATFAPRGLGSPVKYIESIDDMANFVEGNSSCEKVLYCNSVLQYIDEINIFFDLIKRFNPRFILLDDFYWNPSTEDVQAVQLWKEEVFPVTFRSIETFLRLMHDAGFELTMRQPYLSIIGGDVIPFPFENGAEGPCRYSLSMCFRKVFD